MRCRIKIEEAFTTSVHIHYDHEFDVGTTTEAFKAAHAAWLLYADSRIMGNALRCVVDLDVE